jgi:hypothetical protein
MAGASDLGHRKILIVDDRQADVLLAEEMYRLRIRRSQKKLRDMCATAQSARAARPDNAPLPVSFSYRDLRL